MQLLWCSCPLMSVSVCMFVCVRGRVCAYVHVNSSLEKCSGDTFIKKISTIGRKLSPILVTVLCLFAAPAFKYSPLKSAHI